MGMSVRRDQIVLERAAFWRHLGVDDGQRAGVLLSADEGLEQGGRLEQ